MSAENLGGVGWLGKNALFRTSIIVLSVWGDVEKYKWGPKANPYTPDLRTPDCAKGCSTFFAHVNSHRPQSHKYVETNTEDKFISSRD